MTDQTPPPADSVRAVLDRVFAHPEYVWDEAPPNVLAWVLARLADLDRWFETLLAEHPALYWTLVVAMIAVLAGILTHFGVLAYRGLRGSRPSDDPPAPAAVTVRDARWHLDRARTLRDEGAFAEAMAHRFMAVLLDLDRRQVVSFHPAKTPGEYVGEVAASGPLRDGFRRMVDQLYACRFGGFTCTAETWAAFDTLASDVGRSDASG